MSHAPCFYKTRCSLPHSVNDWGHWGRFNWFSIGLFCQKFTFYRILHLVSRRLCNIAPQTLLSQTKRYYILQNKWNTEWPRTKRCFREDLDMIRLHENARQEMQLHLLSWGIKIWRFSKRGKGHPLVVQKESSTQIGLRIWRYWVHIVWRMTHCLHWKTIAAIPNKHLCSTLSKTNISFLFWHSF
jgi:hypothetical protein